MTKAILFFILLVGIFFRFYNLTSLPPSLNWDEVSIGYNAYSILQTGKDEYGQILPLYFRSLDDYKTPGYIYATVVSIALFGYNDFAVRFPSAFFGVLSILFIYLLVYELTKKKPLALTSSFVLAILPWHIQFSHIALEANVALFFMLAGIVSFFYGIRKNMWFLPVSATLFGISFYTYLSFRVIVPLFIVLLVFLYKKKLFFRKKQIIATCLILTFFFVLLARDSLLVTGQTRLKGASIFSNEDLLANAKNQMVQDGAKHINLERRFFHENPPLTYASQVVHGYMTHFSPEFLFFDVTQKNYLMPDVGLLYIWMIPFLAFGIYFLIASKERNLTLITFSLLFLSPLPAAITWPLPHAIRVIGMMLPLTILVAMGIEGTFRLLQTKRLLQISFFTIFSIIVVVSVFYFFHQYTIHFPIERSAYWQYGRKEMTTYLENHKKEYKTIVVSTKLEQPYIFALYFSKYNPKSYLANGGTKSGGFGEEKNAYQNFEFRRFNIVSDRNRKDALFVGKPEEFVDNVKTVYKIFNLDGSQTILFVKSADIQESLRSCSNAKTETTAGRCEMYKTD